MKQKIFVARMLVCLCVGNVTPGICRDYHEWPKVVPVEKHFYLSDKGKTGVQLSIPGENMKSLYLLQCYLNAFDRKDKDFDYTGGFECRLTPLPVSDYAHINLLTDESPQVRDWHTRGVFQIPELLSSKVDGVPIQYPGRGKIRRFNLRGMEIEISVLHLTLTPNHQGQEPRISDLDFKVVVVPDTGAHSSIAEPVNYFDSRYSSIRWPKIISFQKKTHFSGHQLDEVSIPGKNKKLLYVLYCCLNPTLDDEIGGLEFSGDFHCFLFSTYDSAYSGGWLLCDDPYPIRDWEGRGYFLVDELRGKCGDYPDYGRTREFRLRGMDLTLSITHLKLESKVAESGAKEVKIREMDLEVTAILDSTAINDIAAPSKYMEPIIRDPKDSSRYIRNCDSIRLRN